MSAATKRLVIIFGLKHLKNIWLFISAWIESLFTEYIVPYLFLLIGWCCQHLNIVRNDTILLRLNNKILTSWMHFFNQFVVYYTYLEPVTWLKQLNIFITMKIRGDVIFSFLMQLYAPLQQEKTNHMPSLNEMNWLMFQLFLVVLE